MKLRNLKVKDAPFMLEWMHDFSIVSDLNADFCNKDIEDCEKFIIDAQESSEDRHWAIIDDNDEYMGTVSLKHIKKENAEFAIVVRKKAMAKGYSKYAINEVLRIGLEEMKLKEIYWCVNKNNMRAIKFYDKNGYSKVDIYNSNSIKSIIECGIYSKEQINSYIWYVVN